MENKWVQTDRPVVEWLIDVTDVAVSADRLLSVAKSICDSGRRNQIFELEHVPRQELFRGETVIDLFLEKDSRSTARVFYLQEGQLRSIRVASLGTLLRELAGNEIDPGWAEVYPPPVKLRGGVARYKDGNLVNSRVDFRLALHSDIWFPQVVGYADPQRRDFANELRIDNRALAESNTPHLNAFLDDLRGLLTDVKATWELESVEAPYARFIGDLRIEL